MSGGCDQCLSGHLFFLYERLLQGREDRQGGEGHGLDTSSVVEAPSVGKHAVWRRVWVLVLFYVGHCRASLGSNVPTLAAYLPNRSYLNGAYIVLLRCGTWEVGSTFPPPYSPPVLSAVSSFTSHVLICRSSHHRQRGRDVEIKTFEIARFMCPVSTSRLARPTTTVE